MFGGARRTAGSCCSWPHAVPAHAQPVPQAPRERWISEWGEGVCKLVRARGSSPYLVVEVVPGSLYAELSLINPDFSSRSNSELDVSISVHARRVDP